MLPQPARLARPLGGGASQVGVRRAFDGNERGFCACDRGGRDADSGGDGAVWEACAVDGAGMMVRAAEGGVTLAVRAQPGARKTAITGVYGEGATAQLKIAVQAPPVEGRANAALIAFLAETFGVAKNRVELVSGELSRSKVFLLREVTLERAQMKLAEWI